MLAKIKDNIVEQFPYSLADFRKDNCFISFPEDITEEMFNAHGAFNVLDGVIPTYDSMTQRIERLGPVLVDGVWVDSYSVVELTTEELAAVAARQEQLLNNRIKLIQNARRDWLNDNIDPDGIQLAFLLYAKGTEKGVAMYQWSVDLGLESAKRQSDLKDGSIAWSQSLLDFSMFPKPYTIEELMTEQGI